MMKKVNKSLVSAAKNDTNDSLLKEAKCEIAQSEFTNDSTQQITNELGEEVVNSTQKLQAFMKRVNAPEIFALSLTGSRMLYDQLRESACLKEAKFIETIYEEECVKNTKKKLT